MMCSDLAQSVFDQTKLDRTMENAWWVELMLQKIKINGLVKMINASKKLEPSYIQGYIARYKWANRPDGIDIADSHESWLVLCDTYFKEPFPWVAWQDLVLMSNIDLLSLAISKSIKSNVRHISYLAKIYANIDIETGYVVTPIEVLQLKSDTISNIKAGDWFEIRKHIA